MTNQVKVFFVFLAVSAVISIFSFFDVFTGARSALISNIASPLPQDVIQDEDHDGLSNSDESYWNTDFQNPDSDGDGFLDGEEVASGKDPREPAGDDSLQDTVFGTVKEVQVGDFEETNFTDNLNELLLSGMAAGDLSRKADPDKRDLGLNALADTTIVDFYKSFPIFVPDTLNIVEANQANQLNYLSALALIFQNDLFTFTGRLQPEQNPFTQNSYFSERSDHFKKSRDNAVSLKVPSNWTGTHKKIIDLLNRFHLNHMAISKYNEDAIRAIIAFNDIENLNSETRDLIKEVQDTIKTNHLKPEDSVFKVMTQLLGE